MISIQAKNFTLTEADATKIQEKIEKLQHLSRDMDDPSAKIRVDFEILAKNKDLILGTITITLPQDMLRAEAREEKNLLTLTDKLIEEIRPQIEKHKSKLLEYRA